MLWVAGPTHGNSEDSVTDETDETALATVDAWECVARIPDLLSFPNV